MTDPSGVGELAGSLDDAARCTGEPAQNGQALFRPEEPAHPAHRRRSTFAGERLPTEETPEPAPEPLQHTEAVTGERGIIGFAAILFVTTAGRNPFWRPLFRPDDLATGYQVVGSASLLPVADRWPESARSWYLQRTIPSPQAAF